MKEHTYHEHSIAYLFGGLFTIRRELQASNEPTLILLGFPPDLADPNCPFLDIISFQQQLNAIPLLGQFFISRKSMDKTVTSSAQPSDFVQLPASMPATLNNLCMHSPWDQVMISKRKMFSLANLTLGGSTGRHELWWCSGPTRDVRREDRFEQSWQVRRVGYQTVGGQ